MLTPFLAAAQRSAPIRRDNGGMNADDAVVADTRRWVERAVIGLNLCPFAKAVQAKGQVRYVVSHASDTARLQVDLADELRRLVATPPEEVDTTLLIHPRVLDDFLDYNDFLDLADATLQALGLEGVIQIASFHPAYQFAGTEPDDAENLSNRSPYPILHLLREDSVERAVTAFPDAEAIFERNIATLQALGSAGWARLFDDAAPPATHGDPAAPAPDPSR